jgi:predicted dehydrogenase
MRAGKHVYVQKPLTYSIAEARTLARTARETKRVTQMGNQGHSMEGTRRIKELIAAGVIGPVREVHVYTDRPLRYWAQGIPRPGTESTAPAGPSRAAQSAAGATPDPNVPPRWSMRTVEQAILKAMAENPQTPPPGLNWDLFLGGAPAIPYHPVYHPFSWRGWVDFGVSAIGDMGAHLIDQPYWALDLTYPTSITASSTPWGGPANNPASYPLACTVQYEFPARGAQPPVLLYWYDGGLMPPRPPFLPDDLTLPRGDGGGGVFVGEKGILIYETYGNNPRVHPAAVDEAAKAVPTSIPRVAVSHEMNWVQACKGQATASSPFEYAAPLTEVMLLGIIALRAGQGRKVLYDGDNMRVTNVPEVNQFLTREYRSGWSL